MEVNDIFKIICNINGMPLYIQLNNCVARTLKSYAH